MARKAKTPSGGGDASGGGRPSRWTAIPAQRSSAATLKVKVYTILGLLIACALAGVLSCLAWLTSAGGGAASAPVAVGNSAAAGPFAASAAASFLAGIPYSVPVAGDVQEPVGNGPLPGGAAPVWVSATALSDAEGRRYEIHSFAVPGNPPRRLSVTVELTASGPVLVAAPSLQPLLVGNGEQNPSFGKISLQASNAVGRLVSQWATAYASDDRQGLFDLTGDRQSRSYYGIGGMTASEATILAVEPAASGGGAVVRVRFNLASGKFNTPVAYDLLVSDWNTASPRVQAWGASGTGAYLQPFQNAAAGVAGPGAPG